MTCPDMNDCASDATFELEKLDRELGEGPLS
jgi:hypothetical protein